MDDANEMFKRACLIANHHAIVRYLMSNADGRWDGAEKAHWHMELCKFYVQAVLGKKKTGVGICEYFEKLHNDTARVLTDRLDEAIGFPIQGDPDYRVLAPRFFEVWHETALKSLTIKDT